MPGRFNHPDLRLRHQLAQIADGVDVDGSIVRRYHDQGRLAPALEKVAIVAGDPVAQPLAGRTPVGAQLIVEIHLRIVGIDTRTFNQEPFVEI